MASWPIRPFVRGAQVLFAGNPNDGGLPPWPAFDPGRRPTMIFNNTCLVKDDPDSEELKALQTSVKWT